MSHFITTWWEGDTEVMEGWNIKINNSNFEEQENQKKSPAKLDLVKEIERKEKTGGKKMKSKQQRQNIERESNFEGKRKRTRKKRKKKSQLCEAKER